MTKPNKKPELLCPAGSPEAFRAAIEGGADAIYVGGSAFNARINAKNFTAEEMRDSISLAHAYGVKVYIATNTLIFDKEKDDFLAAAENAYKSGADALIIADLGAAELVRSRIPIELHASTQVSGHNADAAKFLAERGFSRMVCAREMSRDDLWQFVKNSPIEAEVFIHGALCVCHSGQCLFSSVVGGRSGNRGECAQPCRLPYSGGYPLSLKDSCLALHIPKLIECGISSLKIEGRMKSPEYVRDVARIYRRLLDENRGATKEEMSELASIFSRGGFTDGYFSKKIDSSMLGVRSDADKQNTEKLVPFEGLTKKLPVRIEAEILRDKPCVVRVSSSEKSIEHISELVPLEAMNAPLTFENVKKQLTKLGATLYEAESFELKLDEGLMLPVSQLNALRREAIEKFEAQGKSNEFVKIEAPLSRPSKEARKIKSATFTSASQITKKAREYFDLIFLPAEEFDGVANGVIIPPVVFDSEMAQVEKMLASAKEKGAKYALVGNLGHIELAKKLGFSLCGDIRLNVFNNSSAAAAEELGFECFVVSPELGLPQARDIGGAKLVAVYGRLPLMLLEKCVGKELGGCKKCGDGSILLKDRRGVSFPVLREWKHRSVIYNSLPTCMSDKPDLLVKNRVVGQHFIFSIERADECDRVINAFERGIALGGAVRRLGSALNSGV